MDIKRWWFTSFGLFGYGFSFGFSFRLVGNMSVEEEFWNQRLLLQVPPLICLRI